MTDWRDSYDDWKLRSPYDDDDDPCSEVRHELGAEINELTQQVRDLHSLVKAIMADAPADADWLPWARELLGLPDPEAPASLADDIAF